MPDPAGTYNDGGIKLIRQLLTALDDQDVSTTYILKKGSLKAGSKRIVSKRTDSAYRAAPSPTWHPALTRWPNHLTDMDDQEILKIIQERLTRVYGIVVRIQRHDAPEWFGDGWLVSFELPTRNSDHAGRLLPQ